MITAKRWITWVLCALLCAPATLARNPRRDGQTGGAVAQDVQIVIGQQQVRFTSQKPVREMQLQIFNQAGELVHDSGVSYGPEINWPLRSADDQPLRSGLYAYVLSIKEQGAETARVRRGHFIVDRAGDREKTGDRLWITSQNESGVGVEMTVARGEESTVAGVEAPADRIANDGGLKRDGSGRGIEGETEGAKPKQETALAAAVTGTVGQLAKFTAGGQLGDSGVTVAGNGRLGIGITNPSHQLRLGSGPYWTTHGWGGSLELENGSAIGWRSNTAGQRFGIGHTNSGLYFFRTNSEVGTQTAAPNYDFVINDEGNVGVGTTTPGQKLDVSGNINYGQLTKLDVATSAFATIRAADLLLGHPERRGAPGRAMVDFGGSGLFINYGKDWNRTFIGSDLAITGSDFLIGHPERRGAPGRAVVDGGGELVLNFAGDWARTTVGSNLAVIGSDFFLGHPNRRGAPGRALVDLGGELVLNLAGDWARTTVGSDLAVIGSDFFLGHPARRGAPGRALVDYGGELVLNFAKDWARTTIGSDLTVLGQTTTDVLEIKGGADFAENFEVNVEAAGGEVITAKVEPGMVVSIDPSSLGKLTPSFRPYDRRVAGIISGAGGVKPGMIMSQEGTLAHGKYPVALSGRVYCMVDASNGAIEPGDLLTTSDTPGHAMKVTDANRAQGAIIGKAMTGLKEGKGLVLVLVTLQ